MKKSILGAMVAIACAAANANAMTELDDQQLSQVEGQALFNLTSTADASQNLNFFKLGLGAVMELNSNIKSLQLGCGGSNGSGGCDIDIGNLSLSGKAVNGSRVDTSAQLTNPFIEFAIKGKSAATREVEGFRLGAESILGLLTLGAENIDNPSDGLRSFSGYMQVSGTSGSTKTVPTNFGAVAGQEVKGSVKVLGGNHKIMTNLAATAGKGFAMPEMTANFEIGAFTLTGKRQTVVKPPSVVASVGDIILSEDSGSIVVDLRKENNINEPDNVLWVNDVTFFMGKNGGGTCKEALWADVCWSGKYNDTKTAIRNLKIDVEFTQALSMIHNIELDGNGGYLSLQKSAIKWLGANSDDIAQPGWWMSFAKPVQLGTLDVIQATSIEDVLPQVASQVSDWLLANRITVSTGGALGSAFGLPIKQNVGLQDPNDPNLRYIDLSNSPHAKLALGSQILANQNVIPNCYGGMKFC